MEGIIKATGRKIKQSQLCVHHNQYIPVVYLRLVIVGYIYNNKSQIYSWSKTPRIYQGRNIQGAYAYVQQHK